MTIPQGQSPAGWQGQWAEQPPPPPQRPSRSPLYFLIFAGVVLFVTVAVIFYLKVFHASTQAANPDGTSSHSAQVLPSAEPSTTPDDSAALTEAREAVESLESSPQCSDPAKAAQTMLDLAEKSTADSDLKKITDSLRELSKECGADFTLSIRSAFESADMPSKLSSIVSSNDWVTLAKPAPADAISATEFTTPADNIRCQFVGEDVACSIYVYDYPSPDGCEGKTATYRINPAGKVTAGCTEELNAAVEVSYGSTVQHNGFACTIDQYEGVTCWNELTGNGFQLRRAADRIF